MRLRKRNMQMLGVNILFSIGLYSCIEASDKLITASTHGNERIELDSTDGMKSTNQKVGKYDFSTLKSDSFTSDRMASIFGLPKNIIEFKNGIAYVYIEKSNYYLFYIKASGDFGKRIVSVHKMPENSILWPSK